MTESARHRFRMLAVPIVWLLGLAFLLRGRAAVRATDPVLRARWQWADSILPDLVWLTIEVLVLVAILRPNSYLHSWQRALVALGLLLPWAFAMFVAGQHVGPVFAGHTLWLLWMVVGVTGLTIMSFLASRGLRYSALFAASVVSSAVIAFQHWVAGATPPAWMAPSILASMLLAVKVFVVGLHQRTHPRGG